MTGWPRLRIRRLTLAEWLALVAAAGSIMGFVVMGVAHLLVPIVGAILLFKVIEHAVAVRDQRRHRELLGVATLSASAQLPWDCETVWSVIKPAETAPLLDPEVGRGYHVPGTPSGLGEWQAFEGLDGSVGRIEVIEYVHNRRAVTVTRAPGIHPPHVVHEVQPADGGCTYSMSSNWLVPGGGYFSEEGEQEFRARFDEYVERVRQVCSGSVPAATATPPAGDTPPEPALEEPTDPS